MNIVFNRHLKKKVHEFFPWTFLTVDPEPGLRKTIRQRDTTELSLIENASREKKPILAICRGIAMLNAALGGTVIQDIETE